MRNLSFLALVPLAAIALLGTSCAAPGEVLSDEGFEIDCRGVPCDWKVVEGDPQFKAGFIDGDRALDLTGKSGQRVVVEQRAVLLAQTTRQLVFESAIVRDAGANLRFELEWYAPGQGIGKTFWDRSPVMLDTRVETVWEEGVQRIRRTIAVPSESAALILRIVKEGSGTVIVDELTLGRAQTTSGSK